MKLTTIFHVKINVTTVPPGEDVTAHSPGCLADMWDRYSQVFSSLWVASAFKGATGPRMIVVDTGYHIENHRSWLQVIQDQKSRFSNFRGYTLTGWQRYKTCCLAMGSVGLKKWLLRLCFVFYCVLLFEVLAPKFVIVIKTLGKCIYNLLLGL